MKPETFPGLKGRRICLVTSGPIGSGPRLIKEADALSRQGAHVQVVSLRATQLADVKQRDAKVLATAAWPCAQLGRGNVLAYAARAAAQRLARLLVRVGIRPVGMMTRAYNRDIGRLAREAVRHPAELYIAHNLAALPAASRAARRHGAGLGFDAEDFHSGELPEGPEHDLDRSLVHALESHYLPLCDYVTAASPGIAKAYAQRLAIPAPCVVLNVFPLSQAVAHPSPKGIQKPGPSLYWFSQTIGPDRGLEDVVRAVSVARCRPHLYLRGGLGDTYRRELLGLARSCGVLAHLHFLAPAPPDEMVSLAAQYDVGLATETLRTENRRIALTNKIFTYLLAGLPTIASATPAQAELANQAPGTILLYRSGDHRALANQIDQFLDNPVALASARTNAWQWGQARFNWDHEQFIFLELVRNSLAAGKGNETRSNL